MRKCSYSCAYIKTFPNCKFLILLLYVDVVLVVRQDVMIISRLKKELSKLFDMKDLRLIRRILIIDIIQDRRVGKLWLSQERYVE